jgi:imidazolonepropionase-like amidohydrolase
MSRRCAKPSADRRGDRRHGLELVRELELYVEGGMTPAEALATATIAAARNVHIDNRTGSIAPGKEADLLLVDGDPKGPSAT